MKIWDIKRVSGRIYFKSISSCFNDCVCVFDVQHVCVIASRSQTHTHTHASNRLLNKKVNQISSSVIWKSICNLTRFDYDVNRHLYKIYKKVEYIHELAIGLIGIVSSKRNLNDRKV